MAPLALAHHKGLTTTIQVRISRGERQFVAECLDLPVVTQAPTLDMLVANIAEAIGLHFEGEAFTPALIRLTFA